MFVTNEVDESTLIPFFDRRSFFDDICFGGKSFDDCLTTLDRLLTRFTECCISISFTKSIFVQPGVEFLSHEVWHEGIRANTKKLAAISNLSKFIQDFEVFRAALYQLKYENFDEYGDLMTARRSFEVLKQKVAEAPILRHFDRTKEVHIMVFASSSSIDKPHPVRFCGRVLNDAEMNYHPAEKEVLALLFLLKTCYTQLAKHTLHVYTRFSTLEWIANSKSLFGRAVQWASTVTNFVDIDDSLEIIAPPQKGSLTARIDPQLLYAKLPLDYSGLVVSFDGSAKTDKNGGYGSCALVVWRLPEWTIVLAANAYLESTTVNVAGYIRMDRGVKAALELGADNLVVGCHPVIPRGDCMPREDAHDPIELPQRTDVKAKPQTHLRRGTGIYNVKSGVRRKRELVGLNRIREVIYDSSQTKAAVKPVAEDSTQFLNTISASRSKPFADFVQTVMKQSTSSVLAVTRSQTTTQKKRVRLADDSVAIPEATIPKPMPTEDTGNAPMNPTKTGTNECQTQVTSTQRRYKQSDDGESLSPKTKS
ncbi:LOW QUALITY PROTEIN: hypothetical protein PHMEG_00010244 [Phytophthora megakarya]|uniref:Reverse transcriptase RNase H-like domain-containing protein n=1 Tax=Phytophthora megakarya TaxID=4795 RepID=A0A225WF58_9STRA|nr:LOW QUALITY PROTEIN: hypothetical protein PHMEG_00010244 [Phytophthora megakarya]